MVPSELENFVNKFRQLWSKGFTAHLDLDTHAGKAWVGLRMQLDSPGYPSNPPRSTARQRRRERREASRKVNNAEKASCTDEDFNDHENTPTVKCDNVVLNAEVINSVELPTENVDIVTESAVDIQTEEVAVTMTGEEDKEMTEEANNVSLKENEMDAANAPVSESEESNAKVTDSSNKDLVPDVIPVYCTATLDNCPDEVLSQEYGQSLRRFIHSEQHLKENVVSSDITHMSTRSLRNNKFVHTVSIIMHVRTARLWESPSKYIRKHLSLENYWTRSNGTIVRLSRIHQKD